MSLRAYAIDWHGHCPYCGVTLTTGGDGVTDPPTQRSKDHIVPQCRGGRIYQNIVWVCLRCNGDKHHLTLLEWRAVRVLRGLSPFLAWDRDWPAILWREFCVRWLLWVPRFA